MLRLKVQMAILILEMEMITLRIIRYGLKRGGEIFRTR